jgi:glycosyltransferase involved in cell wall biosynthesis
MMLDHLRNFAVQILIPQGSYRRYFFLLFRQKPFINILRHFRLLRQEIELLSSTSDKTLLFFDDHLPDPEIGAGYPRTLKIIRVLSDNGFSMVHVPINLIEKPSPHLLADLSRINVAAAVNPSYSTCYPVSAILKGLSSHVAGAVVCRPSAMKTVRKRILLAKIPLIYDAEAIFSMRTISYSSAVRNLPIPQKRADSILRIETNLAASARQIWVVSRRDGEVFNKYTGAECAVVSHCPSLRGSTPGFDARVGFLFVGNAMSDATPNADALKNFLEIVWPQVSNRLASAHFSIVGILNSYAVQSRKCSRILLHGKVKDLNPLYDSHRIFIAPSRYGAGIPLKVLEAAANGIPTVITPILADQLEWRNGCETIVANPGTQFADAMAELYFDQKLWTTIRENGYASIRSRFSEETFSREIIRSIVKAFPMAKPVL